jgi:hypothetical protein
VDLGELRSAAGNYDDLRFLIGKLRAVPYLNSVPGALSAADSTAAALAGNYVKLVDESSAANRQRDERIAALEDTLAKARSRIDSYQFAFSGFARDENEAGFVLDTRNPERVLLYIDPFFHVAEGTSAWVFRSVDEPIAELKLRGMAMSSWAASKEPSAAIPCSPSTGSCSSDRDRKHGRKTMRANRVVWGIFLSLSLTAAVSAQENIDRLLRSAAFRCFKRGCFRPVFILFSAPGDIKFGVESPVELTEQILRTVFRLWDNVFSWTSLTPGSQNFRIAGDSATLRLVPGRFVADGRDLAPFVPSGLSFTISGDRIEYDFRLKSGAYFIRLAGRLQNETVFLERFRRAVDDPAAFARENDPDYISRRIVELQEALENADEAQKAANERRKRPMRRRRPPTRKPRLWKRG